MNIAIGSAFRNTTARGVGRYLQQVAALRSHIGSAHSVRVIAAEGDSESEHVRENLIDMARLNEISIQFVPCQHGQPIFGSTEEPERMKALSKVCNAIFDGVAQTDHVLVYVESDLQWEPAVIGTLIDYAADGHEGFNVFCPMVMAGATIFYDIWGFRRNGERFSPFAPYHEDFVRGDILEVESAGSCLVMPADVARKVRVTNDLALVGWCEAARAAGYRIVACKLLRVEHPA